MNSRNVNDALNHNHTVNLESYNNHLQFLQLQFNEKNLPINGLIVFFLHKNLNVITHFSAFSIISVRTVTMCLTIASVV